MKKDVKRDFLLTIALPTIEERRYEFELLHIFLQEMVRDCGYQKEVEIINLSDNKEISIGEKRDRLYKMAKGEYTVMIDDDDRVPEYYLEKLIPRLDGVDCVGYIEHCLISGIQKLSSISLKHDRWENCKPVRNGIWYHRTPFFKVPIKTDICRKVGVKDMRYAEDADFAKRVYPHLKTENFIDDIMYYYHSEKMTTEEINKRFGIC